MTAGAGGVNAVRTPAPTLSMAGPGDGPRDERRSMKGLALLALGVPLPIIILLYACHMIH